MMKVVEYDRYGAPEVLELRERPLPQPAPGQVLVRVRAAALNPKDALTRAGKFRLLAGPRFPKRCGYDYAGVVEACGAGVQDAQVGDAVFGMLNGWRAGTCAEALLVHADEYAPLPLGLSMEEASALPLAAQTALQALRDLGDLRPGQQVCIHGASGGVGTLAVQVARALGAEVTALCSAANAELVRGLGAQTVVDYRSTPPPALTQRFDIFFDVFGNQSYGRVRHLLKPRGLYISTVPSLRNIWDDVRTRLSPGRRARLVVVRSRRRDLEQLAAWVQQGRLRALVDSRYALAQIREAHTRQQTRRARGKIILIP